MVRFRILCTNPGEPVEKVTEVLVEASGSWLVEDLKLALNLKVGTKQVRSIFVGGQRLDLRILATATPTRVLSWTPSEPGFHIVESASIQCLLERGEGYRIQPVLNSIREVNATCLKGSRAMRASSGSGGVYFLKNTLKHGSPILACFKPRDDEPGTRNNPNEFSTRNGVSPGEAAEREAAAFVLDWNGFSGVPATVLVEAATDLLDVDINGQYKIGSFQYFVQNAADTVGDFSPHLFAAREIHKIGLMDLRFLNMDRNDSNILVVKRCSDEYHLVPIDHGLCFPDHIEVGWCDWVWWDWPQTLLPFDDETKEWVLGLDIDEDIGVLKRCFRIRPACLRVYRCMVMLLKKGVAAGLNLHEIASVVVRSKDIDEPSAMEKTVARAMELSCLMETNARRPRSTHGSTLHKSSSFDGTLPPVLNLERQVSDDMFFSYVERLLEDVVAEILERKSQFSIGDSGVSAGSWFSASTRSSPSELTKIASPRLMPMSRLSPSSGDTNLGFGGLPILNLQQ